MRIYREKEKPLLIIIAALIIALIIYALAVKTNPYEAFAEGAAEAVPTVIRVLPYLAAMLVCINVFRRSGGMDILCRLLNRPLGYMGMPAQLLPLVVLRPFSGSAALALLQDILKENSADSYIGKAASIIVGSTETIFYTIALYCGSIGIKKTRYAVAAALISGAVGIACSLILAKYF